MHKERAVRSAERLIGAATTALFRDYCSAPLPIDLIKEQSEATSVENRNELFNLL